MAPWGFVSSLEPSHCGGVYCSFQLRGNGVELEKGSTFCPFLWSIQGQRFWAIVTCSITFKLILDSLLFQYFIEIYNIKMYNCGRILRDFSNIFCSPTLVFILLYLLFTHVHSMSLQSSPTLCNPRDCSPPGSSVCGIFQAIVLEWIAISFSRGSSQPRDQTQVSRIVDRRFTVWATREVLYQSLKLFCFKRH